MSVLCNFFACGGVHTIFEEKKFFVKVIYSASLLVVDILFFGNFDVW